MVLFRKKSEPTPKRRRKPRTKPWQANLPTRETTRGTRYTDFQCTEDMIVGLTGTVASEQFEHAQFVQTISEAVAEEIVATRLFELRAPSPARVRNELRLSCRNQQAAREILARGEKRGRVLPLPFRAALTKRMPDGPVQHGVLVVERGFDLALLGGGLHRTAPQEWAPLDIPLSRTPTTTPKHGAPLVVGNSDARSSWLHLERSGALAVWPTDSRLLWIFKVVPGHRFPSPFDLASLQRRASGPVTFNRGGKQHE